MHCLCHPNNGNYSYNEWESDNNSESFLHSRLPKGNALPATRTFGEACAPLRRNVRVQSEAEYQRKMLVSAFGLPFLLFSLAWLDSNSMVSIFTRAFYFIDQMRRGFS
jgi:hypothetical protein